MSGLNWADEAENEEFNTVVSQEKHQETPKIEITNARANEREQPKKSLFKFFFFGLAIKSINWGF